jgi:hypothetical protein
MPGMGKMGLVALILALVLGLGTGSAQASGIEVGRVALEAVDEGYAVNAQFEVDLTNRLDEALHSGVSLYFVVEFELVRPRWYWFDEKSVASRLQYRLTYHALSRQVRLWTGTLHQPFQTLSEALRVLGRVRSWVVLERDQVVPDRTYQAGVRMRLDTSQLPKPFQINAITNREWVLSSEWTRFTVTPSALPASQRTDEAAPK